MKFPALNRRDSGLVFAIIAALLFVFAVAVGIGPTQNDLFVGGAALTGCAMASFLIAYKWLSFRTTKAKEAALIGVTAMLLGLAIMWCGMRQFGGFDHSALIDVAWRLSNDQRPYLDFPCSLPIGFYLGAGYAFRLQVFRGTHSLFSMRHSPQ